MITPIKPAKIRNIMTGGGELPDVRAGVGESNGNVAGDWVVVAGLTGGFHADSGMNEKPSNMQKCKRKIETNAAPTAPLT